MYNIIELLNMDAILHVLPVSVIAKCCSYVNEDYSNMASVATKFLVFVLES